MKVNICGIPHEIEEVEDSFGTGELTFGEIDYVKAKILLNKSCTEELKRETLCHEIVHGILSHLGYGELSCEETLVQGLAQAINQTFEIRFIDDKSEAKKKHE